MAKPNHPQPAKPAAPPRSPAPRPRVGANRSLPGSHSSPQSSSQLIQVQPTLPEHRYEAQLRWFEREVTILRQLAQTERLAGDYVAAQRLERELDSFIKEFVQETAALMVQEEPI